MEGGAKNFYMRKLRARRLGQSATPHPGPLPIAWGEGAFFCWRRLPRVALVPRLPWAIIVLPFQAADRAFLRRLHWDFLKLTSPRHYIRRRADAVVSHCSSLTRRESFRR